MQTIIPMFQLIFNLILLRIINIDIPRALVSDAKMSFAVQLFHISNYRYMYNAKKTQTPLAKRLYQLAHTHIHHQ